MSKELTEQWRNGTLPLGAYYVNYQYNERVWLYREKTQTPENTIGLFEVLAKVPDYDEWVKNGTWYTEKSHNELLKKIEKLEQQLNIATNALKNAHTYPPTMSLKQWCEERLKEMEEV